MASSSLTGTTRAPQHPKGTDIDSLGPSDTSDSGSDVQGEQTMATAPDNRGEWGATPSKHSSDSDSMGTGARGSATGPDDSAGADILPDRIVGVDGVEIDELDHDGDIAPTDARDLNKLGFEDGTDGAEPSAGPDTVAKG